MSGRATGGVVGCGHWPWAGSFSRAQKILGGLVAVGLLWASGCESYRIEYHRRPGFYRRAAEGKLAEQVMLDDGTVIVYRDRIAAGRPRTAGNDDLKFFRIREQAPDGSTILRARLPQDVLANTLTCLRNREYELLWEQMLSQQTKSSYEAEGQGAEEFAAFFEKHRTNLAATVSRMLLGLTANEVIVENLGGGRIRCRFYPHMARNFRFKTVELVSEQGGLRLLMIR